MKNNKYKLPAKIYSENLAHENCNCLNVAIPSANATIAKEDLESFCLHCECRYEIRSTNTMKFVVCLYLAVIGILTLCMLYMHLVSPLVAKFCGKYRNLENEQPTEMDSIPSTNSHEYSTHPKSSVFDKVSS